MPLAVDFVLGIVITVFLRAAGFDRDRAVYPTIVIVVATYYVLFAAMGDAPGVLAVESLAVLGFGVIAVVAFSRSLWWAVAGLAGHGLFDSVHGHLIANPGVPAWWPAFCGSIDVALAACLAVLLVRGQIPATRARMGAGPTA